MWNNNIENRSTCVHHVHGNEVQNDFSKLLDAMSTRKNIPDVFTVQQISDQDDLDDLIQTMETKFGVSYSGSIAKKHPDPQYPNPQGCGQQVKQTQTNAVIYRTARFSFLQRAHWRSDVSYPDVADGACRNIDNGRQDRAINVGVAFYDSVAQRTVVVASIHWPTNKPDVDPQRNSHACLKENFREANQHVDTLASENKTNGVVPMRVVGGDANAATSSHGWWDKAMNADYEDPLALKCGQTSGAVVAPCAGENTTQLRRIDFILVDHGNQEKPNKAPFVRSETVSAGDAGGRYSDHLALHTYARY